jgi:hypothetical protein
MNKWYADHISLCFLPDVVTNKMLAWAILLAIHSSIYHYFAYLLSLQ